MFLTMKEAAEIIGVSTARLRDFANTGRIVAAAKIGTRGDRLFAPEEVARFAALPRKPGNPTGFPHAKKPESQEIPEKVSRRKPNKSKQLRKSTGNISKNPS